MTTAEYGSWNSNITPDLFLKCNCKTICELQIVKDNIYWVEQHATTGERELYSKKINGNDNIRWASNLSVQTSIHEYGGGALHVLQDESVIFSTKNGLFQQKSPNGAIEKIADGKNTASRYGDCSSNEKFIYCVNEIHQGVEDPENRLISIDRNNNSQNVVANGADFYAYPRISPDGTKLVWMEWNHVNMPWDETTIKIASINSEGLASDEKILKSGVGQQINYTEPTWISNDQLLLVNDSTNWWNVYQVDINSLEEKNLNPIQQEIGYPLWQLGFKNYAYNSKYLVMNANGVLQVRISDAIFEIPTPEYTVFSHLSIDPNGSDLVVIASGPKRAASIISINLEDKNFPIRVHRESLNSAEIDEMEISLPEEFTFSSDGTEVSGFFYPPKNSDYKPPKGSLPPLLLLGHSGPTAPAPSALNLQKQFFTSRGIAIAEINYRGSTGFGTSFRKMLYKNYGVADRDDILNGAKALVEQGKVDGEKIMIKGCSSGGYLLLRCLLSPNNIIKAAVSSYGVADLIALDKDTHKFEKYYNQLLIGKYPEEAHIYEERSPINHIDKIKTPIAFLHGTADTVVPPSQSVDMFEKLRAKGIMTALVLLENEGHGFRSGESIKESTEVSFYFLLKAVGIKPTIQANVEIFNEEKEN